MLLQHKYVESQIIYRSSHSLQLLRLDVFKSFTGFKGKHLCWSLFLIKLQAWGRCFLVKSAKFLRTPLFTEHLLWLLPDDLLYLVPFFFPLFRVMSHFVTQHWISGTFAKQNSFLGSLGRSTYWESQLYLAVTVKYSVSEYSKLQKYQFWGFLIAVGLAYNFFFINKRLQTVVTVITVIRDWVFQSSEAVTQRCSVKKGVSQKFRKGPATSLKKNLCTGVFL